MSTSITFHLSTCNYTIMTTTAVRRAARAGSRLAPGNSLSLDPDMLCWGITTKLSHDVWEMNILKLLVDSSLTLLCLLCCVWCNVIFSFLIKVYWWESRYIELLSVAASFNVVIWMSDTLTNWIVNSEVKTETHLSRFIPPYTMHTWHFLVHSDNKIPFQIL